MNHGDSEPTLSKPDYKAVAPTDCLSTIFTRSDQGKESVKRFETSTGATNTSKMYMYVRLLGIVSLQGLKHYNCDSSEANVAENENSGR